MFSLYLPTPNLYLLSLFSFPYVLTLSLLLSFFLSCFISFFTDQLCDMAFSCDLMHDPVVAADGFTYERSSITEWLSSHSTSPTTNEHMDSKTLFPNVSIRAQIIAWKESHNASVAPLRSSTSASSSKHAPSPEMSSSSALKSSAAACPTHPNEPLRAFCITCKKTICSDCAVDSLLCKSHITRSVSSIIAQLQSEHAAWQQVHRDMPHQHQVRRQFVFFATSFHAC